MSKKSWSKEEVNYLEENWGNYSIPKIANNLKRTVYSIKNKAYKMGLGNHLDAGEEITLNKLFNCIYQRNIDSYLLGEWKREKFPIKYKTSIKKRYKVVLINDFWKWAEKHQGLLNFKKFDENILGKEPKWVKIKRKNDKLIDNKYIQKPWAKNEDDKLKKYISEYKYSFIELSKMLMRSEGAIQRRLLDLGIKGRPIKADNHIKWTKEEFELLGEMIKSRTDYKIMSSVLGKSEKAIRGRVYYMYLTENLDKAAAIIGKGKWGDNRPSRPITHRTTNEQERSQIKKDMSQFVGIIKGLIKNQYDNDDYWQKDMCMNWNGYMCTENNTSCDICTKFIRIKPQYCRRCGATIIDRNKRNMCDRCKVQRKKQHQRKFMAMKEKINISE